MSLLKKLATLSLLIALPACTMGSYGDRVPERKHFKKMVQKDYDLENFSKITVDLTLDLYITQGDEQKLSIRTEEDHFEHLDISVRHGHLKVDHVKKHRKKRHTSIEIQVTNLEELNLEGAVEVDIQDITPEDFELNFDGIGEIVITGSCINAELNIDGIGALDAYHFKCDHVEANMSGIGSMEVYAAKTIELDASGIGSIDVRGNPKVLHKSVSGIGSVFIEN